MPVTSDCHFWDRTMTKAHILFGNILGVAQSDVLLMTAIAAKDFAF